MSSGYLVHLRRQLNDVIDRGVRNQEDAICRFLKWDLVLTKFRLVLGKCFQAEQVQMGLSVPDEHVN